MSKLIDRVLALKDSDGRSGIDDDKLIAVLVEVAALIEAGGGGDEPIVPTDSTPETPQEPNEPGPSEPLDL